MINPNKTYSASQIGTITEIQNRHGDIDTFTVDYGRSGSYKGYVSDIPNFKRFKVGDQVKAGMEFSITSDRFVVRSLRKVNRVKVGNVTIIQAQSKNDAGKQGIHLLSPTERELEDALHTADRDFFTSIWIHTASTFPGSLS